MTKKSKKKGFYCIINNQFQNELEFFQDAESVGSTCEEISKALSISKSEGCQLMRETVFRLVQSGEINDRRIEVRAKEYMDYLLFYQRFWSVKESKEGKK